MNSSMPPQLFQSSRSTISYGTNIFDVHSSNLLHLFMQRLPATIAPLIHRLKVRSGLLRMDDRSEGDFGGNVIRNMFHDSFNCLKPCVNLDMLEIGVELDTCKNQRFVLEQVDEHLKAIVGSWPRIKINVVSCMHCDDDALYRKQPSPQNKSQRYRWFSDHDSRTFHIYRSALDGGEIWSLSDILAQCKAIIEPIDRPGSIVKIKQLTMAIKAGRRCNHCDQPASGMPADIRFSRPHWCPKCELVLFCSEICKSRAIHGINGTGHHAVHCVDKPFQEDDDRRRERIERQNQILAMMVKVQEEKSEAEASFNKHMEMYEGGKGAMVTEFRRKKEASV